MQHCWTLMNGVVFLHLISYISSLYCIHAQWGMIQYIDTVTPDNHLISTMGFRVLVTQHLYIESGPWLFIVTCLSLCVCLYDIQEAREVIKGNYQHVIPGMSELRFLPDWPGDVCNKVREKYWEDLNHDFIYCIIPLHSHLFIFNWQISQIPECTCFISQNAPFRTEMCTFLFWMEHYGIWNRCILGFVNWVIWLWYGHW